MRMQVAAVMERDHRRLAAQELEAAGQLGVGLVAIPSLAQRQKLDAVVAKAGTSGYDAAWLALQEQEHRQLLTLIATELAKGTEPAVKSVAKGAQPVVQMHLRMVEDGCHAETAPSVPTGDGGQVADAERIRSRTALVLLGLECFSWPARRSECGDASSALPRGNRLVMVFEAAR